MTGGTGLVGNALGQELVRQNHQIVILSREGKKARERLSYPCEIFEWKDEVPSQKALQGVEAIIHLAGENIAAQRWTEDRKQKLRSSRLGTTAQLVEAVRARGTPLKVFISASAIGIYGDRDDEVVSEGSAAGTGFLAELCKDWEAMANEVPAERCVHARLGVVISELGGFLDQVVPMFNRLGASVLGSGRQYLSWVHLHDVVRVLLMALTDARFKGAVNVVAPNPITNQEMTAEMKRALKTFSAPAVPSLALKLLYGELSTALLGSQRVRPKVLESINYKFSFSDFSAALKAVYGELDSGEMQLTFEHWVPGELERVWDFYSDEQNLEKITPPILNFHVVAKSTPKIQSQTLIDYKLKLHGIPLRWQTRIEDWQPMKRFSDSQLKGPYRKWHHVHEFDRLGNGVVTRDQIRFKLPLGFLGRAGSLGLVLSDVRKIFAYRSMMTTQVFGVR